MRETLKALAETFPAVWSEDETTVLKIGFELSALQFAGFYHYNGGLQSFVFNLGAESNPINQGKVVSLLEMIAAERGWGTARWTITYNEHEDVYEPSRPIATVYVKDETEGWSATTTYTKSAEHVLEALAQAMIAAEKGYGGER